MQIFHQWYYFSCRPGAVDDRHIKKIIAEREEGGAAPVTKAPALDGQ